MSWGLGFRVLGFGFWVLGFGFGFCSGFRDEDLRRGRHLAAWANGLAAEPREHALAVEHVIIVIIIIIMIIIIIITTTTTITCGTHVPPDISAS